MEFTINIDAQEAIKFSEEILPAHREYVINGAASYSATAPFGSLLFQKTEGSGFTIWTGHYFVEEDRIILATSNKPVLFLHFLFQNEVEISLGGTSFSLADGQFNLSYLPVFKANTKFQSGQNVHTFHIHFEYEFLQSFTNGYKLLPDFLSEMKKGNACRITASRHFATSAMISVVNNILKNPYEEKYHQFFIEAHVKVLLLQALHKIHHEEHRESQIRLSPHDIEKIITARNYLLAHLDSPVSIKQLARIAAINEYTLKKGFKQVYSMTIHKYYEHERLQKGMQLLIETDLPVAEIAYTLGYMHPTHFSSILKK
ncbi:MAG: AraC family transcriptional regulator, partial [Ginsengibacter sp.]